MVLGSRKLNNSLWWDKKSVKRFKKRVKPWLSWCSALRSIIYAGVNNIYGI